MFFKELKDNRKELSALTAESARLRSLLPQIDLMVGNQPESLEHLKLKVEVYELLVEILNRQNKLLANKFSLSTELISN